MSWTSEVGSQEPVTEGGDSLPALCHLCRHERGLNLDTESGLYWCKNHAACNKRARIRLGVPAWRAQALYLAETVSRTRGPARLQANGLCNLCTRGVRWVATAKGKKMPLDLQAVEPPKGTIVLNAHGVAHYIKGPERATTELPVFEPHFATCSRRKR